MVVQNGAQAFPVELSGPAQDKEKIKESQFNCKSKRARNGGEIKHYRNTIVPLTIVQTISKSSTPSRQGI
jgi:hypothetical protein